MYETEWKQLSPTALITFLRCPMKYYFSKIAKIEVPMPENAFKFGRTIHTILEKFYIEIEPDDYDGDAKTYFNSIMLNLLNKHWDYSISDERKTNNDFYKEAEEILINFANFSAPEFDYRMKNDTIDKFFPAAVEEDIVSEKLNIRCIVDRRNQSYNLVDYKSNKMFPDILLEERSSLSPEEKEMYDDKNLEYLIQGVMNAMVVEDKYGVLPSKMTFLFVRHLKKKHNGMLEVKITDEKIKTVTNYINMAREYINAEKFPLTAIKSNCTMYNGCEYKQMCDARNICIMAL
jgi:CRISPR/Cas system-associated exonuclease Cas4 (RecB family)